MEGAEHAECVDAIDYMLKRNDADMFSEPVDWEYYGLTDYPLIIKQPMDLGTVKRKLNEGTYGDKEEFIRDVNLVWFNAQTYNQDGSDIYRDAEKLKKAFEKRMNKKGATPRGSEKKKKSGNHENIKGTRVKLTELVFPSPTHTDMLRLIETRTRACAARLTRSP